MSKHDFNDAGKCCICMQPAYTDVLFSPCPGKPTQHPSEYAQAKAALQIVINAVACPVCNADVGSWCNGGTMPGFHSGRLDAYIVARAAEGIPEGGPK